MPKMTRAEWEAHRFSNEPFPPWSIATWEERGWKVAIWIISAVIATGGFIGIVTVFGLMMEVAGQQSEDHDRCLKRATNGYEIERCR